MGRLKIQVFIHLVGQNPRPRGAAVLKNGSLLFPTERPAGGIVGRVDNQQLGVRCDLGQELGQVQRPRTCIASGVAVRLRSQGNGREFRAHDHSLGRQVGPHRRDRYHFIPSIHQGLHGEHQCVHTTRSHSNPLRLHGRKAFRRRVLLGHHLRDSLAQRGKAQVVGVKGFSPLQRIYRRLANEVGGDFIAFTEPKSQNITAA